MADITNQMYGAAFYRRSSQGWSEKFWLKTTDYPASVAAMTALVTARLGLLPSPCQLIWCRVAYAGRPRERKPLVLNYPLDGNADVAAAPYVGTDADVNDVEAAVQLALGTATGRWANYYMRAIPDDRLSGRQLINPVTVPSSDVPITPVNDWEGRLGNYLQLLRTSTQLAVFKAKGIGTAGDTYSTEVWDSAIIRGIRNKKTGRPFGESRGRKPVGAE